MAALSDEPRATKRICRRSPASRAICARRGRSASRVAEIAAGCSAISWAMIVDTQPLLKVIESDGSQADSVRIGYPGRGRTGHRGLLWSRADREPSAPTHHAIESQVVVHEHDVGQVPGLQAG